MALCQPACGQAELPRSVLAGLLSPGGVLSSMPGVTVTLNASILAPGVNASSLPLTPTKDLPVSYLQTASTKGGLVSTATSSYTMLRVTNNCLFEGGSLWMAAAWLPVGQSEWVVKGWWTPSMCNTVYFGDTQNRYWYLYAEKNTCDGKSVWSGNTRLRVNGGSTYSFFQIDIGSKIIPTYTQSLTCSAPTRCGYCRFQCTNGKARADLCT